MCPPLFFFNSMIFSFIENRFFSPHTIYSDYIVFPPSSLSSSHPDPLPRDNNKIKYSKIFLKKKFVRI